MNEKPENMNEANTPVATDIDPSPEPSRPAGHSFRVYPIRWVMVLILALINGTNAFLWISFAPVANHFIKYYSTTESVFNWIQMLFPITTVVFGLPASLFVDLLGVRFVILSSATLHLVCGVLRAVSVIHPNHLGGAFRLPLIITGQLAASFGQPLCMFSTTKLAILWFSDSQRTTANNIASLGNTLGVLIGSFIMPVLVQKPEDIPRFNYISVALVLITFLLAVFLVWRSEPLTPPSAAAEVLRAIKERHGRSTFIRSSLTAFKNALPKPFRLPGFWILLINFGFTLAYLTTLSTMYQQILCAKGYSNQFAGIVGAIMLVGGLLASGLTSIFVDRTGLLMETMKVCSMLFVLGGVGLAVAMWYPRQQVLILLCNLWMGAFGLSQYTLSLEVAAEATFPVPESITTGVLIITSQLLSALLILFLQAVAPAITEPNSWFTPTCGEQATPRDYVIPNFGFCALLILLATAQLFGLHLPYKRRNIHHATVEVDSLPDTGAVTLPGQLEQLEETGTTGRSDGLKDD